MTSCVHKMCERTYGQASKQKAIALDKICHPWNWYNMCMLRSWPTRIPNMNKMRQKTNDKMRTQYVRTDVCSNKHEKDYNSSQKSTICEIGIICTCSDHGQPRYQVWIKSNKRQMTSCVQKMCRRTYGQTNMKMTITLAKINLPWNRYNMHMLRSWPTKMPNMNKMRQKTND